MNFFSIGSGSSGNCYCLYNENHSCLMIDCGLGIRAVKKAFREKGLALTDVRAIIVTHAHADHVKSVGSICQELLVPVYATKDTHNGIHTNMYVHRKVPGNFAKCLRVGESLLIDGFRVTAFDVPHDSKGHVGYSIECADGVVFTIVTDCGQVTDTIREHISMSDYLVLESNYDQDMLRRGSYPARLKSRIVGGMGHLDNRIAGKELAQNATPRLRHVWLCHLSQENNTPSQALATVTSELRDHGIVAGKDFLLDVLQRKTPSDMFEL